MSCEDIKKVLDRLDELEILLNTLLEEMRELKKGPVGQVPKSLVDVLKLHKFIPLGEVKSRQALRQAMERGLVVVLRDEGANREVVVLKEAARQLLDKLPLSLQEAERLDRRSYELLQLLNRLGYVLLKGSQYVKTDLAEEFYI
ncbi:MAG: hypothetical protein ACK4SY_04830 [Pyrobaculum sp.]